MRPYDNEFDDPYEYTLKMIIDEELNKRLLSELTDDKIKNVDVFRKTKEIVKEVEAEFKYKFKLVKQVCIRVTQNRANMILTDIILGDLDDKEFRYKYDDFYVNIANQITVYCIYIMKFLDNECHYKDRVTRNKQLKKSFLQVSKSMSIKYRFPIFVTWDNLSIKYDFDAVEYFRMNDIDITELLKKEGMFYCYGSDK